MIIPAVAGAVAPPTLSSSAATASLWLDVRSSLRLLMLANALYGIYIDINLNCGFPSVLSLFSHRITQYTAHNDKINSPYIGLRKKHNIKCTNNNHDLPQQCWSEREGQKLLKGTFYSHFLITIELHATQILIGLDGFDLTLYKQ